jgi:hypothetical protein
VEDLTMPGDFVHLKTQRGSRPPSDAWVDVKTAAKLTNFSAKQILDLCHDRKIRSEIIDKKLCVQLQDLEALKPPETADAQSET